MQRIILIAVIMILSRVALFGAAVSTNEQILDSLGIEAINDLFAKQTFRFGDTIWIEPASAAELSYTKNFITRVRPDIIFAESQRLPAIKSVKLETSKTFIDLGILTGISRQIVFASSWDYTDKDSKIVRVDSRRFIYSDTLDYSQANPAGAQLASHAAPSFYKQYIEPALIIGSVAVITALFFFVRSN